MFSFFKKRTVAVAETPATEPVDSELWRVEGSRLRCIDTLVVAPAKVVRGGWRWLTDEDAHAVCLREAQDAKVSAAMRLATLAGDERELVRLEAISLAIYSENLKVWRRAMEELRRYECEANRKEEEAKEANRLSAIAALPSALEEVRKLGL